MAGASCIALRWSEQFLGVVSGICWKRLLGRHDWDAEASQEQPKWSRPGSRLFQGSAFMHCEL